ncbi:MAG: hypothetical protein AYP45_13965 [Candidatus Brocadia carolinensis]|uniref:Uncharacterized protein n=1 Tax=Candidatus Brocadia carolinensis TaxID=1004156 RepID=A0A1V4AR49_9BACT|nr:MAG: hypothetical protein AYP45_13965 [Candidatus Brocadia caroliniensis]
MSTAILEKFLIDYVEAKEGEAELVDAGTYTILYGSEPTMKTVTFEIEAAKENHQIELFLPGSIFFDAIVKDATARGCVGATWLSGFQVVTKIIQSEAMKTFSFVEHEKDGVKKREPKMSSFQPYNVKVVTFAFKVRMTTDIIEDHLYIVSIDARTSKILKNFMEYLSKFQHLPQFEEDIPDYHLQDFSRCYQIAIDSVRQKLTGLIVRKKQEAADLKNKEAERMKKYYDTLNAELEEALEKKAEDREAVANIQAKQKAMLVQRQSALSDIEFRYRMGASMSLVSVLVTNYPCYIAKVSVPSSIQTLEYDIIWNPLFKRFEPLVCPTCKNHSYAMNFLRSGIRCQNCFT